MVLESEGVGDEEVGAASLVGVLSVWAGACDLVRAMNKHRGTSKAAAMLRISMVAA